MMVLSFGRAQKGHKITVRKSWVEEPKEKHGSLESSLNLKYKKLL